MSFYKKMYHMFETEQKKWYAEGKAWLSLLDRARREGNEYWVEIYSAQARECLKGVIGFEF